MNVRKPALATRGSRPAQIIDGRIVDPLKLAEVLDRKFGKGNYDVEMRHNRFLVRARAKLTEDEIEQCSYC